MNSDELGTWLAAVANPQRMRILGELSSGQKHVSDLARRVGMSRALLYMHLAKLEESGFIVGHHELSDDGKALKFFEVIPFCITITPALLAEAVAQSARDSAPHPTGQHPTPPSSTPPAPHFTKENNGTLL